MLFGRRTFTAILGGALAGIPLMALQGCTGTGKDTGSNRGRAGSGSADHAPTHATSLLDPDTHACDVLPAGEALWSIDARDIAVSPTAMWAAAESTVLSVDKAGDTSVVSDLGGAQALRIAANDTRVCVACNDGTVACLDAGTKQLLWTAPVVDTAASSQTAMPDDGSTPAWEAIPLLMSNEAVYALFSSSAFTPSCWIAGLSLQSGEIIWQQPTSYAAQAANGVVGSWIAADNAILTTVGSGIVTAIDMQTGDVLGSLEGDSWVVGGITTRPDGGYLLQTADGTLVTFSFMDGAFQDVEMRRLTDAAPLVAGVHNTRPIDLGSFLVCRVPADVYEEPTDGSAARMKMTLGIVDAKSFEVLDRLDDMDPQRQPLLLKAGENAALYVAANNLLYRVDLDGASFAETSSLGISVLDSESMMHPEPQWCEDIPAILFPTDSNEFTAIG